MRIVAFVLVAVSALISQSAHADVSRAVSACIAQSLQSGELLQSYRADSGTKKRVGFKCSGSVARYLYDSVQPYTEESGPYYDEANRTRYNRYFGTGVGYSACSRTIYDSAGSSTDQYHCWIDLDMDQEMMNNL